jgi:nitroreductase
VTDTTENSVAAGFEARYAGATPRPPLPANQVFDVMLNHRTVRRYLPTPLPQGTLEALIAAAASAPTSSNLQTWSVIAVQDPARIARLAELSNNQRFITTAPLFLCWLADLSRLERLGEARGQPMEALPYLEMYQTAALDSAFAAQNVVVAAESLGLGTCYIGGLRTYPVAVAEELKLPPNVVAVYGLSIGYPDPAAVTEVKPRLPQSLVLHHETYDASKDRGAIPAYDQAMLAFSQRNGMGAVDWSNRAVSRAGKVGGMNGRHQMTEFLHQLGFGIR